MPGRLPPILTRFSVNVELPMRGPRPAGFAFAFYKTEEQAKAAVEKLNGQGKSISFHG